MPHETRNDSFFRAPPAGCLRDLFVCLRRAVRGAGRIRAGSHSVHGRIENGIPGRRRAFLVENRASHLKLPKLQVQAVPVLESTRISAVINGEIDIECAGTTNSKARREQVAFGLPYFYAGSALMVREGGGITGLGNCRGKKLGTIEGSTSSQIAELKNDNGGWTLKTFKSMNEATAALGRGEIDALMYDDVTLLTAAAQSGGKLSVLAQRYSIEPLAPMFSKSDPELEKVVLQAMQQLYRDGEMDAIYKRWFLSPLPGLGYNLNLKMSALLQDNLRRPTSYVADWTVM